MHDTSITEFLSHLGSPENNEERKDNSKVLKVLKKFDNPNNKVFRVLIPGKGRVLLWENDDYDSSDKSDSSIETKVKELFN